MGDEIFEEQCLGELARKVGKMLQLKRSASLLSLGGRQWRFGKLVAGQNNVNAFVYADSVVDCLREAEEEDEDMLTIECELDNYEQLAGLGKYDGVLLKGVLERATDLQSLFAALYKILKMDGRAVFMVRLSPNFPLPERVHERWTSNVPDLETVKKAAADAEFQYDDDQLQYGLSLSKARYRQALAHRSLPFCDDLTDAEIDQVLNDSDEPVAFQDEITLIGLSKDLD